MSIARQQGSPDGATCLLGVVLNGRLTVANIGDSIATLVRKDGSWLQLNSEHCPMRPDERQRIEAAKGFVLHNRINGELSVSRAFGDLELKDFVISEPECRTLPLSRDDDLLVLASDGIHRSYSQDQIVRRIAELRRQTGSLGKIAEIIVEDCLRLEGALQPCNDNVTLIIVSLADYVFDYEHRNLVLTPQLLQLRKQSSMEHCADEASAYMSKCIEYHVECQSLLQLSSEDG